jgi:O-antigen biosynthesis protein
MSDELLKIFNNHQGKLADKWQTYLSEWERLFASLRNQAINLFEIGVHNGGSLEIWAKYFGHAEKIVGVDNNQDCQQLSFSDPRISVIIGDVNSDAVESKLQELSSELHIIIDDGSHQSGDIIQSFLRYFKFLQPGGYYLIEDLHASYWDAYNGGLNNPYSALSFLKGLADIVNFEHWRNNNSKKKFLLPYETHYGLNFEETDLFSIHSIKFLNSMCVIHKKAPEENMLGQRLVVGSVEEISTGYKNFDGASIQDFSLEVKEDGHLNQFFLIEQTDRLQEELAQNSKVIRKLRDEVADQNRENQLLHAKIAANEDCVPQTS